MSLQHKVAKGGLLLVAKIQADVGQEARPLEKLPHSSGTCHSVDGGSCMWSPPSPETLLLSSQPGPGLLAGTLH